MKNALLAAGAAAALLVAISAAAQETQTSPPGTTITMEAAKESSAEMGVRKKVSQAKADMRSMATGIEAYYVDNNVYPSSDTKGNIRKPAAGENNIMSFAGPQLTTPIAYLTKYYSDPFAQDSEHTFSFYSAGKDVEAKPDLGWILISPGPDGKFDVDYKIYDPNKAQPSPELMILSYDATNGTTSGGDVFRVKQ